MDNTIEMLHPHEDLLITVEITHFDKHEPQPWNDASDWDNKGWVEPEYEIVKAEADGQAVTVTDDLYCSEIEERLVATQTGPE